MFGFYRIAAVTPRVVVADVSANLEEHLKAYRESVANGASLVAFPELSLTGATCGDLFRQDVLLNAAWKAAHELAAATDKVPALFGLPVAHANVIFDAVAVAANGKLVKLLADCSNTEIFSHDASLAPSEVSGVAFGCHGTFDGDLRLNSAIMPLLLWSNASRKEAFLAQSCSSSRCLWATISFRISCIIFVITLYRNSVITLFRYSVITI